MVENRYLGHAANARRLADANALAVREVNRRHPWNYHVGRLGLRELNRLANYRCARRSLVETGEIFGGLSFPGRLGRQEVN